MTGARSSRNWVPLALVAGFTVWSIGFVLLYALQGMGCAWNWPFHRGILILAFLATLAVQWLVIRAADRFAAGSEIAAAVVWANRASLLATVLVFLPVGFVTICV